MFFIRCGKSHWVYSFVKNLRTHTNILKIAKKINILFAYNESSSIEKLDDAIKNSGLPIEVKTSYQVPTLTELNEDSDISDNHKIVILEDLQPNISLLSKDQQFKLASFLTKSRHIKISILYVQHSYSIGQHRNIFDSFFRDNLNYLILFRNLSNQSHKSLLIGNLF